MERVVWSRGKQPPPPPPPPHPLLDVLCSCTVSRAGEAEGQCWQSVTERAVWLKEMEPVETANVCFQLCLWPVWVTATAKQMPKQLGRAGGCFYCHYAARPPARSPPPRRHTSPLFSPHDCTSKLSTKRQGSTLLFDSFKQLSGFTGAGRLSDLDARGKIIGLQHLSVFGQSNDKVKEGQQLHSQCVQRGNALYYFFIPLFIT